MRSIVFDTGPIITLTLNNLLWILKPLKEKFGGEFYITKAVKSELIDYHTKKFKFEAFQVLKAIKDGILKVYDSPTISEKTHRMLELANESFTIKGRPLRMLHYAEVTALVACLEVGAAAFAVDEHMTRLFIENPSRIGELLRKRFHHKPARVLRALQSFRGETKRIHVIRSTELVTMAYEKGILDQYLIQTPLVDDPRKELLEALLWGLKLNGCSISEKEIQQVLKIERNVKQSL